MNKIYGCQRKGRGSITIEASVSMVIFTFLMVALLLFIKVARIQTIMGTAVQQTAYEMSQYAYFYKLSGLYDFEENMYEAAEKSETEINTAVSNIDEAILGVEEIYSLISNGGKQLAENAENGNIEGGISTLQSTFAGVQNSAGNSKAAIQALNSQIESIIENPQDMLRSFLALLTSAGTDELKSQVAAVMAKQMCLEHLGNSGLRTDAGRSEQLQAADEYLRSMGVVDGWDGQDFSNSTMFHSNSHSDINIIVTYKIKVITLFNKDYELTFAQSASTRGWIGDGNGLKQAVSVEEKEEETQPAEVVAKFNKNYLNTLESSEAILQEELAQYGITLEEFKEWQTKDTSELLLEQLMVIKAVRNSIPAPDSTTLMQKVVNPDDIAKYLSGEYNTVGGFVAKAADTAELDTMNKLYEGLRLDYGEDEMNPENHEVYYVMRFRSSECDKIGVPYNEDMGGSVSEPYPFMGNGFTASEDGELHPEYKCDGFISIEDGAEIYTIDKDGNEVLYAVYSKADNKFNPVNNN